MDTGAGTPAPTPRITPPGALATPTFAQTAPPGTTVFFGPLGLRAGWGIVLFLVLTVVLGSLLVLTLAKATHSPKHTQNQAPAAKTTQPVTIAQTLPSEVSGAAAVLLAAFALSRLEFRRFGVYGLPARRLRDALPGAAIGLAAISLLILLLRACHLLAFDRRLLAPAAAFRSGAAWLLVFVLVGLFEEFLFRGYLQFTLTRGLLGLGRRLASVHARRAAFWLAALLLSSLFMLTHLANAGEDPAGIAAVLVAGILFSYILWRTGSLWWGIGFHMTWDWGQSFLFGVPDSGILSAGRLFATHPTGSPLLSGGVAGPEGSLLALPVLLLVALAVRLHPQATQPPLQPTRLPATRALIP